jgi:hypothetical protein
MNRWDDTKDPSEQKFLGEIKIVVESDQAKEQLLLALEYIHDLREIDTDFMAVNALVHLYQQPNCIEVKE